MLKIRRTKIRDDRCRSDPLPVDDPNRPLRRDRAQRMNGDRRGGVLCGIDGENRENTELHANEITANETRRST